MEGYVHKHKEDCTGCSACSQLCPKNAIKMVPDEEGFLYPQIDHKLCVHCGVCERFCQSIQVHKNEKKLVYAAKNNKNIPKLEPKIPTITASFLFNLYLYPI